MILTIPGLWNSGPDHWQSHWERELPDCRRVEQHDWDNPKRDEWVQGLDAAVAATHGPVLLAAHSLGCALVAWWAQQTRLGANGALLVAPSDVELEKYPKSAEGFRPMPTRRLPFPSIVVASEDDEWVSIDRAQQFARGWGSRFVSIGRAGHINSESKLGNWLRGQELLRELLFPGKK